MKKFIIVLLFLFLLSGCSDKPVTQKVNLSTDNKKHIDTVIAKEPGEANNDDPQNYDLSILNIVLPANWKLDTSFPLVYNIMNEKSEEIGKVMSDKYEENYFLKHVKPNHSSVVNEENIDIPFGKCSLYTLDVDNGTAASGAVGTHNAYYAIIDIKEKSIYSLSFTKNDKDMQTKEQFIGILKNLSLNQKNDQSSEQKQSITDDDVKQVTSLINEYFSDIEKKDYSAAWELTSSKQKKTYPKEEALKKHWGVENIKLISLKVDKTNMCYVVTLDVEPSQGTAWNKGENTRFVNVIKDNGGKWSIDGLATGR